MIVECPQCGHEHEVEDRPIQGHYSVNDFIQAVLEADTPLIEKEIAERAGVSRPTVAAHREEIRRHPDIYYRKIGKPTIYWRDGLICSRETNKEEA